MPRHEIGDFVVTINASQNYTGLSFRQPRNVKIKVTYNGQANIATDEIIELITSEINKIPGMHLGEQPTNLETDEGKPSFSANVLVEQGMMRSNKKNIEERILNCIKSALNSNTPNVTNNQVTTTVVTNVHNEVQGQGTDERNIFTGKKVSPEVIPTATLLNNLPWPDRLNDAAENFMTTVTLQLTGSTLNTTPELLTKLDDCLQKLGTAANELQENWMPLLQGANKKMTGDEYRDFSQLLVEIECNVLKSIEFVSKIIVDINDPELLSMAMGIQAHLTEILERIYDSTTWTGMIILPKEGQDYLYNSIKLAKENFDQIIQDNIELIPFAKYSLTVLLIFANKTNIFYNKELNGELENIAAQGAMALNELNAARLSFER